MEMQAGNNKILNFKHVILQSEILSR